MALKSTGLTIPINVQHLNEVIVYPAGITLGTTAISDNGVSPAYTSAHTTTANISSNTVGWSASISLSEAHILKIASLFIEFEWQSRFNANSGGGASSQSKVHISGNGGTTCVDLTDTFTNTATSLTTQIRAGTGRWLTQINMGGSQLQFRLIHGGGSNDGTSQSIVQDRSNSYIRIGHYK